MSLDPTCKVRQFSGEGSQTPGSYGGLCIELNCKLEVAFTHLAVMVLRSGYDLRSPFSLALFAGVVGAGTNVKIGDLHTDFSVEMKDHIRLVAIVGYSNQTGCLSKELL